MTRTAFQRLVQPVRQVVSRFSTVPSIHQTISGRVRFYKQVDVVPTPNGPEGEVISVVVHTTLTKS